MLRVFLVEDESVVREGLRDNIPWQQFGYEFAGEASDGEIALPLIRKLKPDVLITDIKMPFMDGLALSSIVTREFPDMKIIIISGYDDFEYARQAIQIGVEQYLLKPVTRGALQKALLEIREKIETEWEQKDYLKKFQKDMQEYEQFERHRFFEKVLEGALSVQEIYEEAEQLSLDLNASCYNLVMVNLREKKNPEDARRIDSEIYGRYQEEILRYFLKMPEYVIFQWTVSVYGILIMGEPEEIGGFTEQCVENVKRICELPPGGLEWHVVAGKAVERLSMLPEVYSQINHLLSYRFLLPGRHILTEKDRELLPEHEAGDVGQMEITRVNPDVIQNFLKEGQRQEVEDFVSGYLQSLSEPLKSKMFRDYLVLSVRFAAIAYAEKLGYEQEEFLSVFPREKLQELVISVEGIGDYVKLLLERAIALRDKENQNQGKKMIKKALEYIEEHYTEDCFSLNMAAEAVHVSPNYFSALFSQEMQTTFIEYVTQKRMEKAKKLLRQTERTSREIAGEAGYKDSHYFSFVFKKTQGCTPREYRKQIKNNQK